MALSPHFADSLMSCFREVFECRGKEFGRRSGRVVGLSDDNDGVQWHAPYYVREGAAWLGVNLEGKEYEGWPVARFIERELSRPLLLTRYRRRVPSPERVMVRWTREAWQAGYRIAIKDPDIAPTPIALDRLDARGWADGLRGARGCLDPERGRRGRRKVMVTLGASERRVLKQVVPHLVFRTELATISLRAMREAKDNLEPLHEFVRLRSER